MRCFVAAILFLFSVTIIFADEYRVTVYVAENPGNTSFFYIGNNEDPKVKKVFKESYFTAEIPNIEFGKTVKIEKPINLEKGKCAMSAQCGDSVCATVKKSFNNEIECEIIYRRMIPKSENETNKDVILEDKFISTKIGARDQWTVIGVPYKNCTSPALIVMACKMVVIR